MLALLGLVPGLLNAWNNWQAKKVDAQVEMYKAKTGSDTETARNLVVAANVENATNVDRLKVVASNKWLTFLFVSMAAPLVPYIWKVIFFDKIACKWIYGDTCTTDPIAGDVGVWCGLIIGGIFGVGVVQHVTKSWFYGRSKD